MTSRSRKPAVAAGLALILFPLLALLLKASVYPGWMMVVIIFAGIPLLLGYILQVVVASVSMFRTRGAFNTMAGARRGVIAAWLTSVAVLLSVFFLVDGGDDGVYGSAFTAIVGNSSTSEGEQLSMTLFMACAVIWVAAWAWLVVEWIVLGVRARREARSTQLDRAQARPIVDSLPSSPN